MTRLNLPAVDHAVVARTLVAAHNTVSDQLGEQGFVTVSASWHEPDGPLVTMSFATTLEDDGEDL